MAPSVTSIAIHTVHSTAEIFPADIMILSDFPTPVIQDSCHAHHGSIAITPTGCLLRREITIV